MAVSREHANPPVEIHRVVVMSLVHHLVEIDAGDTFIYDEQARATRQTASWRPLSVSSDCCPQGKASACERCGRSSRPNSRRTRALQTLWTGFSRC